MKKRRLVPPPSRRLAPPPPTINDLWFVIRRIASQFVTIERRLVDVGRDLDTVKRHIDLFASLPYTPEWKEPTWKQPAFTKDAKKKK